MNWAAAFYAATIWMLAASIWHMYRPIDDTASHLHVGFRVFQDVVPAALLGLLLARVL